MYNEAPWVSQQQKFWGVAWISLSQLTVEGQAQQDCSSQSGASHMSLWTASRAGLSSVREGWTLWSLRHCVQICLVESGLWRDGNLESHTTGNQAMAEIIPKLHLSGKRLKTWAWTMSEERGTAEGEPRASPRQDEETPGCGLLEAAARFSVPQLSISSAAPPEGAPRCSSTPAAADRPWEVAAVEGKWEKELWSWAPNSVDCFPSMLIRTWVSIILFNSCTHIPGSSGSWLMQCRYVVGRDHSSLLEPQILERIHQGK